MADSPDADFPLRVAVVDIGSNAIRFTASEFLAPTTRQDLEYQRVPVRLGRSAFLTGRLTEENMAGAVEAMASFRRRVDVFGVKELRAVATSAVRESVNGGELVERVRRESGIRIETVTGSEEARLVWLAARSRLSLRGRWMLMDLGGGSLELSVVTSETIEWSESHTVGTVRILEQLGEDDATELELRRLLEEYTATLRVSVPEGPRLEGLIATGGNIEELAEQAGCAVDGSGVHTLKLEELEEVNARLASMSYRDRVDRLGLRPDRADVIVPAGMIYARVARMSGMEEIVVPHVGIADGALLDLVEEMTTRRAHVGRQEQAIHEAAVGAGRRFRFDEAHGRHVARLALQLFDALEDVHGLDEDDRRILLAAALLHDIGQFVSYRKHHKHSFYLIRNSELSVCSPEEILLVGLVARYHRRAHPKESHDGWSGLGRSDRQRVRRLAAILRVADALDREHLQRVSDLRARRGDPGDGEVVLEVTATGDLLLERWALEKKGLSFFREAFGRSLRLEQLEEAETGTEPPDPVPMWGKGS